MFEITLQETVPQVSKPGLPLTMQPMVAPTTGLPFGAVKSKASKASKAVWFVEC
jgi:hypothetical protein